MLDISEIFYSIQGESSWAGMPCVFVRLSGCNLRCSYCDARYTYEEEGLSWTITEIVEKVAGYRCQLVEITGGEPLFQSETILLCNALLSSGHKVLLETNGSLSLHHVPGDVRIIVDVKCPGSDMGGSFNEENIRMLRTRKLRYGILDEVKFVLTSEQDYYYARDFIRSYKLEQISNVLLSPVISCFAANKLAELMLTDCLEARLQLQLHTLIWPNVSRGK